MIIKELFRLLYRLQIQERKYFCTKNYIDERFKAHNKTFGNQIYTFLME